MADLIVNDDLFRTDPQLAYALSWGMTFYLSEKKPEEYYRFLRKDGKRKDFQEFSSKQRSKAFSSAFGGNIPGMEAEMKRFITQLDVPRR